MTKIIKYTWAQLEEDCVELSRLLVVNNFKPDVIISLTPHSEIIKIMLCNFFELTPTTPELSAIPKSKILYVGTVANYNRYQEEVCNINQEYLQHEIKYATIFEDMSDRTPPDFSVVFITPGDTKDIEMPWEDYWKKL